jgi:hypothetical protein
VGQALGRLDFARGSGKALVEYIVCYCKREGIGDSIGTVEGRKYFQ